jgi:FlaG/FlaF family flagellin (archaellin)
LLIAFTVGVAGIISVWLTGFAKTSTDTVGSQANTEIVCNSGIISFSDLGYCSTSRYLSGDVSNTGTIALGNISMQIIYANGTQHSKLYLLLQGSSVSTSTTCCSNLTISPSEKYRFNISGINSNYDVIRVITNCTSKVTDEAKTSDVTASC